MTKQWLPLLLFLGWSFLALPLLNGLEGHCRAKIEIERKAQGLVISLSHSYPVSRIPFDLLRKVLER